MVEQIKGLQDISNVSQVQLLDMPDRVSGEATDHVSLGALAEHLRGQVVGV